jgi:solute:Na+ symporter, SSS family
LLPFWPRWSAPFFAFGKGGPAYNILWYAALCLRALIFHASADSQTGFLCHKYDCPTLGVIVSLVGIVTLIPHLVLRFWAWASLCRLPVTAFPPPRAAVWAGAAVATAHVMASGFRGSAWTAVVKDITFLAVVVFLGIYFPLHYCGGLGAMFAAMEFTALPAHRESTWWFSSTVLLTALASTFGPTHSAPSILRRRRVSRAKAVVLPLYWHGLEMASRHSLVASEIPREIYGRALVGNFDASRPSCSR